MITINRTYTITLLDSNVINYTITSNKSCITIINASGSSNGTTKKISVTYYITDTTCFTGNTITIIVTNDKGCSNTFTDTLINECNSLDVSIKQPDANNLSFNAIVTGGNPPYLYNWIYGLDSQFDTNEPTNTVNGYHSQDNISIKWIGDTLPPGYDNPQGIRVKVKDANECVSEDVIYYQLSCKPSIASQSVLAKCSIINNAEFRKFTIELINLGCGTLNNSELLIDYTNAQQTNIGNNKYEIIIPEFQTTTAVLPIKVLNDKNIPSSTFNITVVKSGDCKIKPDCATGFILDGFETNNSKTIVFDNTGSSAEQVIIFTTLYIDFTTFTFVPGNGQSIVGNKLVIANKGEATFDAINKKIIYTKTNENVEGIIPITWKIKNECDIFSDNYTLNINSVNSTAPFVNNITKTVILGDTSTTTVTSANNVAISSFKTILGPTIGTLTTNENVVTYTPISYSATNQVVTLQAVNQYGKVSNNFTITYTILSSGIARPLTTCSSLSSYNLFNLLVANSYTAGGTWTSSPSVNTGNLATITTAGIYNFTYTVTSSGLTKSTTVTINYSSAAISSIEVTNSGTSKRTLKITTTGFTPDDLAKINYISVTIISSNKQIPLPQNLITNKINSILFSEIDITYTDGTILTDYDRIDVIIPEELTPCGSSILGTYIKSPIPLSSTLTVSATVNKGKLFNCNGDYTYTYENLYEVYNGSKSVAAIAPVNPYGVENASFSDFGIYGTRIYPVNGWDSKGDLKPGYNYQSILTSNYWRNNGILSQGPVNRHAIWADDGDNSTDLPENIWIGFSRCITLSTGKVYYVGLAGDNNFRLRLNGVEILNTKQAGGSLNSTQTTFYYWHIYPIYIFAGNNTLELTGWNNDLQGAIACVIYNNTVDELVNANSNSDLTFIFDSKTVNSIDIVQTSAGVYQNKGYTCPQGYNTYSSCDGGKCIDYIVCGTPILIN